MAKFMFLIRGGDYEAVTPDQMGSVVEKFMNWSKTVRENGNSMTGDELADEAVVLPSEKGQAVTADGLFTEAKDLVGGYFIVEASDMDTAVRIAGGCPSLEYGGYVEVRPIIER